MTGSRQAALPRGRRREAWLTGAALLLALGALPRAGRAQTVERRVDLHGGGAVSTVYPGETAQGAHDIADLLIRLPGVVVERGPGGSVGTIAVRGGCRELSGGPRNPLVIIDGLPIPDDDLPIDLRTLSPFQVERIEVLRDVASTSVYGTRGACGVLLIYTRRGGVEG